MINYMYLSFINIPVNIHFTGDVGIFIRRLFFILERLFCSEPNSNCDTAENSLVKWCETKLLAKVQETVENNYFLRKRALSFDLVECLRATTKADCVAKSCFWFSGKDCIPKELVP